jgi:trimethylamine--corrinoid protein Co-methyltransferase
MTHPHTLEHMRTEYFNGNGVTDRRSRNKWEQDGGLDARERGRRIARKILSAPETPALTEEADNAIRRKFTIHL